MRRFLKSALLVASSCMMLLSFSIAGAEPSRQLNIYNWNDFIDPAVIEAFTKETGIKVKYDVYDNDEILQTKLLAGGSGYDLVVPSGTFLSQEIAAGALKKLDRARLKNIGNLDPALEQRAQAYDKGNQHAIVYLWGTTGIGYNEAKIKAVMPDAPVNSWELVFKPENIKKFASCGVYFLDSPDDVLPSMLVYLGLDPDSKNPADIKAAGEALGKIRPFIQKFHSSEYVNALANGDICIAVGYSGDIRQAAQRAAEAKNNQVIRYVAPDQGAQIFLNFFAVPADAKNVDEVYEFLDFMMRPEVVAKVTNFVGYPNGNAQSLKFVEDAVKSDPAVYPSDLAMKRLFAKSPYDQKTQRLVTRTWTKVLTNK